LAQKIPVAWVRFKVMKLLQLNTWLYEWFAQVNPTLAPVLLLLFYLFLSYIPAVILAMLYPLKQPESPKFVFNQQDLQEI
jgi:hypothetical protein